MMGRISHFKKVFEMENSDSDKNKEKSQDLRINDNSLVEFKDQNYSNSYFFKSNDQIDNSDGQLEDSPKIEKNESNNSLNLIKKPRNTPMCARCANHYIAKPVKGHKHECGFKDCSCTKCLLMVKRQEINAESKYDKKNGRHVNSNMDGQHLYEKVAPYGNNPKNSRKDDSEQSKNMERKTPKCARCFNHGKRVQVKDHKYRCKYRKCTCPKCKRTIRIREIMAKTIFVRRRQNLGHLIDDSASESDNESGYSTECDEELKIHVNKLVPIIWSQLIDNKLTLPEIGQTLLSLYLKSNKSLALKQTPNSITKQIIEASKQMTFKSLSVITPIPLNPLTPTTSTLSNTLMSPPSSGSSTGSPDSPNESFRYDSGLFARNPFLSHIYNPYMTPFGQKSQWFVPPMPPILAIPQRLAVLNSSTLFAQTS